MEDRLEVVARHADVQAKLGDAVHETVEVSIEPEEPPVPHTDDVVRAIRTGHAHVENRDLGLTDGAEFTVDERCSGGPFGGFGI